MTRKLLPYEYDLIDALGITKKEYFDFVAQQHIYQDPKQGTALDIRAEPVSIILAVVGILFQVASILLMPKPKEQKGTDQTRDAVLAPRIGFNGTQDLAIYGDTVPLVYTNTAQNANGGVRVSSLLLWSAILSFGNNQFMRLMMTIGAASIATIDPERTALGQFPAKDLVYGNVWQYYNENGPTLYQNLIRGETTDPTLPTAIDTTARLSGLPNEEEGFSQAFSPTTASSVGVTGFIPINVELLILNDKGESEFALVNTSFKSLSGNYWPDGSDRPVVPVGDQWELSIPNTAELLLTTDTSGLARQDALRDSASRIDNGAIFKAGSALFRVMYVRFANGKSNIEEGDLIATLECTRSGQMPSANYNFLHWRDPLGNPVANLYVKGLARVEEASYSSVTKCNVLDLALRFQAYRRISGRASVYGSDQNVYGGHNTSDNGAKARTAMFVIFYRFDHSGDYIRLPYIFCCRGINEQDVFAYLKLISRNAGPRFIEITLETVIDTYTEIRTFHTRGYCYLDTSGPLVTLGTDLTENGNLEVYFNGSIYLDSARGD